MQRKWRDRSSKKAARKAASKDAAKAAPKAALKTSLKTMQRAGSVAVLDAGIGVSRDRAFRVFCVVRVVRIVRACVRFPHSGPHR